MITRQDKWEVALNDFVNGRANEPFEWGKNDCALFVCDAIQAMTGSDLAADFRGKYTTELGAARRIKTVTGGMTVEDVAVFVTKANDMPELPSPLFAQRGDVVCFDGEFGVALGIVYMNGKDAVFVSPEGLKRIPVKQCRRAWKVGA
jgi:hypothetical protein